jgi:hypothetical protein
MRRSNERRYAAPPDRDLWAASDSTGKTPLHPDFLMSFDSSVNESIALIERHGYVQRYRQDRDGQTHYVFHKCVSSDVNSRTTVKQAQ